MNPYDRIAEAYASTRTTLEQTEKRYLDTLLGPLDPSAHILDLGCGTGLPIARYIGDAGHDVTAVDSSAEMLRRARTNAPDARLVRADIRTVRFEPRSFEAVIAWDSVFHIPRAEHEEIYRRCFEWLEAGDRLLLSTGGSEWEGTSEMFGEEFFYSGWDPETMKGILRGIGFGIDLWEVDDASSRGHVAAVLSRRLGAWPTVVMHNIRVPPGNRLEKLRGNRAGQYSIRINAQFRISFDWTEQGPTNVKIVDYHS